MKAKNRSELSKQELDYLNKCWRESFNRSRVCMFPDCTEFTIKGHVFPKTYLKNIAPNDEVVILNSGDRFKHEESIVYFERVKIGRQIAKTAHGMKVFCKNHDHGLFEDIENISSEKCLREHDNILAWSYKALAHEYFKNIVVLSFYEKLKIDDFELYKKLNKQHKEESLRDFEIPLLKALKADIEDALETGRQPLDTATFVVDRKIEFFMLGMAVLKQDRYAFPFTISAIPYEDKIYITFAATVGKLRPFTKVLSALNPSITRQDGGDAMTLKILSDLALRNFETWGCSVSFYEEQIKHREDQILELMCSYFPLNKKQTPIDGVSLFD